ncbi:MAG: zinc-dependent metalloprotease [Candidatus Synoicihabitans palmerolidicus]|nr:zinc-dependent metalloprotease [Candidatus Synoicihabitans palmerolidicus]
MDFATPIDEPIVQRFINRHRLHKIDPSAERSEAREPIIYYLDPGTPEPIRSALLEGASWWNQAFEAAGFINAFQVKILPPEADPMDVRYNLIQWVHRSTRGWSYGNSVTDPRTGEIIKGHVSLGSLRARHDLLIAEGLLQPYTENQAPPPALMNMVLARIRQLSAHEVGHTLGLRHNYAASVTQNASVMDYPHPKVTLDVTGEINLSEAYPSGIGAYDQQAIKYGYREFAPGTDEAKALESILSQTRDNGLLYITDQDARPSGGAHPFAHLWDNGLNAATELNRLMEIRRILLDRFSPAALRPGAPMAQLEEALVPIYLCHRYQVDAASKLIGGLDYTYAIKGDGQLTTRFISPPEQRKALAALLATLSVDALSLPPDLLEQIATRPPGYPLSRETFARRTSPEFDPLSAAETAADLTLNYLLNPIRANRLVLHHARDPRQPDLVEVLDRLIEATWQQDRRTSYPGEIQRVIDKAVLYGLMHLATSTQASDQARALVFLQIERLRQWIRSQSSTATESAQQAHLLYSTHQIDRWLDDPTKFTAPPRSSPPDGSPSAMARISAENTDLNLFTTETE